MLDWRSSARLLFRDGGSELPYSEGLLESSYRVEPLNWLEIEVATLFLC